MTKPVLSARFLFEFRPATIGQGDMMIRVATTGTALGPVRHEGLAVLSGNGHRKRRVRPHSSAGLRRYRDIQSRRFVMLPPRVDANNYNALYCIRRHIW